MAQAITPPTPRERKILPELHDLAERQGFAHHVADAATGQIITTVLDRPPTRLSRAERLSRLGHSFDTSVFGPRYRLTPRVPCQASPLNWLTIYDANIARPDGEDLVFWSLPRDFNPHDPPGLRAYFGKPPAEAGRCVSTLIFEGGSWDGLPGHVVVRAYGGSASASITVPFAGGSLHHTIDIVVASTPGNHIEVFGDLLGGLHIVVFYSITLARELVIDPGTF
jgi:hypothetical protein